MVHTERVKRNVKHSAIAQKIIGNRKAVRPPWRPVNVRLISPSILARLKRWEVGDEIF